MRTLAELHRLCTEYVEVAFPDSRDIDAMTDAEIRAHTGRMHSLALRIADLVVDAGVHRGEVLR